VAADEDRAFEAHALFHDGHLAGLDVGAAEVELAAAALGDELDAAGVDAAELLAVKHKDGLLVDEVDGEVLALGDAVLAVADFFALRAEGAVSLAVGAAAIDALGVRGVAALEEAALDLTGAIRAGAHVLLRCHDP
jgi:hypothetical protein